MKSRKFLLFQLGTEGILAMGILVLIGAKSADFNFQVVSVGFTGSSEALPTEILLGILCLMLFLFSIVVFSSLADHFMSK